MTYGGDVRLQVNQQLAVSDLPIAFQQTIMKRPLYDMQRQVQALSGLIQVAHAFLKYLAQFL
jgi:hypothetical protein